MGWSTHLTGGKRPKYTPLLRLRRKTRPSEDKCLVVMLVPASSSSRAETKDCWDLHILLWQEAAGGAHAREEPGPGSLAHSDYPCTMTWSWMCPKNPQEGLVGGNKSYTNLFHYVPQSQI